MGRRVFSLPLDMVIHSHKLQKTFPITIRVVDVTTYENVDEPNDEIMYATLHGWTDASINGNTFLATSAHPSIFFLAS
tara:strand:+ start:3287 stop:3520 length:234 start_codon:yes stop_codon:yes gene_type:complete